MTQSQFGLVRIYMHLAKKNFFNRSQKNFLVDIILLLLYSTCIIIK